VAITMPPSTRGAARVIVATRPWQSIACTVVRAPSVIVTSSRCPKPPASSKAIPSISPGAAIEAKRRTGL